MASYKGGNVIVAHVEDLIEALDPDGPYFETNIGAVRSTIELTTPENRLALEQKLHDKVEGFRTV